MSYEEETYTYPEIIALVRNRLIEYFRRMIKELPGEETTVESHVYGIGGCKGVSHSMFKRVGVVDGGSNVIALNNGYIGVVVSIGLVIEDNHVIYRVVGEPEIVPNDPRELPSYESRELIGSVIDKIREALVFETASKILNRHDVDLLVLDGPLIPYGALAKIITRTRTEYVAWRRYREAVVKMLEESVGGNASVIGFVKRPRSRYLARMFNWNGFDHIVLSKTLKPGQYYPDPPMEIKADEELFHEREVLDLVERVKPRFTYMRFNDSTPPFRIDYGYVTSSDIYRDVLEYLYSIRTREGIPYIIMKADEETKITRKLIRELYEDALHTCIIESIRDDRSKLIPLLPEYGGV